MKIDKVTKRTVICFDKETMQKVKEVKTYFPVGLADWYNQKSNYKAYILPISLEVLR